MLTIWAAHDLKTAGKQPLNAGAKQKLFSVELVFSG